MVKNGLAKQRKKIDLALTPKERELLLDFLLMDTELEKALRNVPATQSHVHLVPSDLLNLYGWINAPGNQSKDAAVQRTLDAVCERAQRLIPEDMFSD
jgi:hypothetical protein